MTYGCIDRLTREELQGVIAHEFSHICNGDIRLNLRLVGVLHGILLLGLIGYGMLRVGSSVDSDSDGRAVALEIAILIIGCGVTAIGFIGLFFGRLIQAAVCRQREFLADAAAVQFTRNPGAMANALKKLGALGSGSRIGDHTAEQIAHMFFASSMGIEWGMFATHPPLAARIKAIDANWDGKFPPREGPSTLERYGGTAQIDRFASPGIPIGAAGIIGTLGEPQPHHIAWASDFLTSIPPAIDQAARDPFSARALVFALLLSADPAIQEKQYAAIRTYANPVTLDAVATLMPPVAELGSRARRILLDLTLPALRLMSNPQADQFRKVVKELVDADNEISIFEFMLYKILAKQLPPPGASGPPAAAYFAVKPLLPDLQVVLSALAAADGKDSAAVEAAFRAGISRLDDANSLTVQTPVGLPALDAALDRLALAAPGVKRRVVDACAHCVAADGMVQTQEGELLHAITSTLDCPLPPLLAENVPVPQPA